MVSDLEKLLLDACESFVKKIDKYDWALIYESDFRYAIYADLITTMEQMGLTEYPIRTEYKYGNFAADIAMGDNQEIAIELKFSVFDYPLKQSDFVKARQQLKGYLENGAQKAYLICLDHQIMPDREPLSRAIAVKEIGLSGDWREINGPLIAGDQLLIATLKGAINK
jgi:hypothetical protein